MSNTSSITPYETESSTSSANGLAAGMAAAACIAATAGLVAWLAGSTDEERAAIKEGKRRRRRETLDALSAARNQGINADGQPPQVASVGLRLRNTESLVKSAQKLGYRIESLSNAGSASAPSPVLLQRASGERLALTRSESGSVTVHAADSLHQVESLVRQHTLDRTLDHLRSKDMRLQVANLANGEVQIIANEPRSKRGDGAAEIKAQIHTNGSVLVDVDKIRGSRCAEIVSELASAVGGSVSGTTKKDSYFQLPGEAAKTDIKL